MASSSYFSRIRSMG